MKNPISKIVWVSIILSSSLAHSADIQVNVTLLPEGAWQKNEVSLIQDSAEKAFRRLGEAKVANCGYRYASKENKDKLRKLWGNQIPVINKSRKVDITINKKELEKNVLGGLVLM